MFLSHLISSQPSKPDLEFWNEGGGGGQIKLQIVEIMMKPEIRDRDRGCASR